MKKPIIITALALLPSLAACNQPAPPSLNWNFGNAVHANIAAQVVNPEPNYATDAPLVNGKRSADAIQRYRLGKVYPPVPPIESVVREGASQQPADASNTAGPGVATDR